MKVMSEVNEGKREKEKPWKLCISQQKSTHAENSKKILTHVSLQKVNSNIKKVNYSNSL